MKQSRSSLLRHAMLILLLASCGEEDNPISANNLSGDYVLVSLKDKPNDIILNAGEPQTVTIQGETFTVTVSGSLSLTDTRYNARITQVTEFAGLPPQTLSEVSMGTYTVNGSNMTVTEDETGLVAISTLSVDGNRITTENNRSIQVWQIQ